MKLAHILLDRNVPSSVVRTIFNLYQCQSARVKWKSSISEEFEIRNGVKQGGVLSPILFSIYIDDLLLNLSKSGYGCYTGHHFAGAFAYADDVVLLSPNVAGLQHMLDIATSFCSSRDIKVNTEKTFSVVFSKNGSSCDPQLYINNTSLDGRIVRIASKSECTHLGHKLTSDLNQGVDIGYQRNVFIRRANGILATFGQLRSDIRTRLLFIYACSFYGCELWPISDVSSISSSYRSAIRRALGLPPRAKSILLPIVSGLDSFENIQTKRCTRFYVHLYNIKLCSFLKTCSLCNPVSTAGNNIKSLRHTSAVPANEDILRRAGMLQELLLERDLNGAMDSDFVVELINFVSTY